MNPESLTPTASLSPTVTPVTPRKPLPETAVSELLNLAFKIARTFRDDDEFLSAANFATFEALQTWDESRGVTIRRWVALKVHSDCIDLNRKRLPCLA